MRQAGRRSVLLVSIYMMRVARLVQNGGRSKKERWEKAERRKQVHHCNVIHMLYCSSCVQRSFIAIGGRMIYCGTNDIIVAVTRQKIERVELLTPLLFSKKHEMHRYRLRRRDTRLRNIFYATLYLTFWGKNAKTHQCVNLTVFISV